MAQKELDLMASEKVARWMDFVDKKDQTLGKKPLY